jgi:hypothetical protein
MEQWTFVVAAFGITAAAIGAYVLILRARLRAAEDAVERENPDS